MWMCAWDGESVWSVSTKEGQEVRFGGVGTPGLSLLSIIVNRNLLTNDGWSVIRVTKCR